MPLRNWHAPRPGAPALRQSPSAPGGGPAERPDQAAVPDFGQLTVTDAEFALFRKLIFEIAGINLSGGKKVLLIGRLSVRLRHFGFSTFSEYFRHVSNPLNATELQTMVDLLTTNETFFFREPQHFDFLRDQAAKSRSGATPFRVWSAASSSGEEAYTSAMVLAETLGARAWEVIGTDISTQVLKRASAGHYPLERIDGIPPALLKKYCLKGIREHAGTLLITRELRQRVHFHHSNLLAPRQDLGTFDIIFLRNVMIYFDTPTKRRVIDNLLPYLKRKGHLVVGHSESLHGLNGNLAAVRPTIYRRVQPAQGFEATE